jgi:hypothetical protein
MSHEAAPSQPCSYDLLKQEYLSLREEISHSIGYQHKILIYGYAGAGLLFGYVGGVKGAGWLALVIIPFILTGMVALWVVECNRMVRASYYIGEVLWPAMRACVPGAIPEAGWEDWIRRTEGKPSEFRERQHVTQRFVVVILPTVLSLLSILTAAVMTFVPESLKQGTFKPDDRMYVLLPVAALSVIALMLWRGIHIHIADVSNLGKSPIQNRPAKASQATQEDPATKLPA